MRAERIKSKPVLDGANGPTLPKAEDVLHDRGVLVVPDIICNAGGVTVRYFEWVQDFSSFFCTPQRGGPAILNTATSGNSATTHRA